MTVTGAMWCIACGLPPDVAITIERDGVMAHYGACWAHVVTVARRARDDVQGQQPRLSGPQRQPAIEAHEAIAPWGLSADDE